MVEAEVGEVQEHTFRAFFISKKRHDRRHVGVLHTCLLFVVGQPHRLFHLRRALLHIVQRIRDHNDIVWVTKAGDIARYVETLPDGVVP